MNYIIKFMDDHGLVRGTPFKIDISKRLWFCFNEDYELELVVPDEYLDMCMDYKGILLGLLYGNYTITEIAGQ